MVQMDSVNIPLILDKSGIIAVTNKNQVNCYDTLGKLCWNKQFEDKISFLPIIDESILLVGTANGDLTKLKLISGEIIESVGIGDSIYSNLLKISYQGNAELMIPKVTDSRSAVIFSTAGGSVHCLDLETLQEYWTNYDSPGKIKSQLTFSKNKIIFTGADNFIYCIDATTGILIWRWKENDELSYSSSQILSDEKNLFVVSSQKILYALDLLLGKLNWKLEGTPVFSRLGISSDMKTLFAISTDSHLLVISPKLEKVAEQIPLHAKTSNLIIAPFELDKKYFTLIDSVLVVVNSKKNIITLFNIGLQGIIDFKVINQNKYLLLTTSRQLLLFKPRDF